jgi:hypothetical protein
MANLRHFAKKKEKKEENILPQIPFFWGKESAKRRRRELKKFLGNHHSYLQHERVLKNFLLSYFDYRQIWLNILMDYRHLSSLSQT